MLWPIRNRNYQGKLTNHKRAFVIANKKIAIFAHSGFSCKRLLITTEKAVLLTLLCYLLLQVNIITRSWQNKLPADCFLGSSGSCVSDEAHYLYSIEKRMRFSNWRLSEWNVTALDHSPSGYQWKQQNFSRKFIAFLGIKFWELCWWSLRVVGQISSHWVTSASNRLCSNRNQKLTQLAYFREKTFLIGFGNGGWL